MVINPDLFGKSNSALAMAFGMCVQSTPGTVPVGTYAMLADELSRRGLLTELMTELGTDRARAVTLLIVVDRSRRRNHASSR